MILDRYDDRYSRTIEELKHRYYSIARRLLEQRKDFEHPILKSGYNYEQEMKRRACLERMISKSKEENIQEANLLKQSLEVQKRIEKYEKFENELKNLTDETKFNVTFEEYVKANAGENDSFVYLRSNKMKYNLPVSEKIHKKVESLLKELGVPDKLIPTNAVEQAYDNLRNNLIILTSLRKHLDKKEREFIKLNHINNELQNKYAVPKNIIGTAAVIPGAYNNINSLSNLNTTGTNANAVNNIANNLNINNPSNISLSLQESNDNTQATNFSHKEKTRKINSTSNANANSGIIPNTIAAPAAASILNPLPTISMNVSAANANKFIRKVIFYDILYIILFYFILIYFRYYLYIIYLILNLKKNFRRNTMKKLLIQILTLQ